jgi:hypothetical protein
MTRLLNALILFMPLGCNAHIWRDPDIVYGFEDVIFRTTYSNLRFKTF